MNFQQLVDEINARSAEVTEIRNSNIKIKSEFMNLMQSGATSQLVPDDAISALNNLTTLINDAKLKALEIDDLINDLPAGINFSSFQKDFVPTAAEDFTKFVTPNGTGNVCTLNQPCNLNTAISQAQPGDVIALMGGTYSLSSKVNIYCNGTEDSPITIESFPGWKTVFDGSSQANGVDVRLQVSGNYLKIRNIEVKNMPVQGITISGNNNVIEKVTSQGNRLSGILIFYDYVTPYGSKASYNLITNCKVYGNSDSGITGGEYANGGNADGISIPGGIGNIVEYCHVYRNSDDGIDAWRSQNTNIRYNVVYENGIAAGNGNGIKAGGPAPSSGTLVEHNLVYSNNAFGFDYNNGTNITFNRNTSWDNADGGYLFSSDTTVSNNIAAESSSKIGSGVESNNSWNAGGNVTFISTDPASKNFLVPTTGASRGAYSS